MTTRLFPVLTTSRTTSTAGNTAAGPLTQILAPFLAGRDALARASLGDKVQVEPRRWSIAVVRSRRKITRMVSVATAAIMRLCFNSARDRGQEPAGNRG